jgi:Gas vesicle synthesis protein GvpL/GvpF
VLYLYAITQSPDSPDGTGLRGAPLRAIGENGVFAVASEHEDLEIEAGADLWAHEEVVERLMDRATVLPVRLGTLLADESEVREALRRRHRELAEGLERVRGAVELGVRALLDDGDEREPAAAAAPSHRGRADAAGPGTAYLLARLASHRRIDEAAERIHRPLASLARASTRRRDARRAGLLNVSYLVDGARVEPFRARVEQLAEEMPDASIVCTGPWPPYSFSSSEVRV